jgi:CDP-glucose 4,6-dehydratase
MTIKANKKFWENKKVLITGHTGFKGSWLSLILYFLGAEVYGLSNKKNVNFYQFIEDKNIFKKEFFIDLSTEESTKIKKELEKSQIEIIFHFAAQSLVSVAYNFPEETMKTNILGTYKILDFFNSSISAKLLTISTTDKVYKNPSKNNKEEDMLGFNEFYSFSKYMKENLIQLFKLSKLSSNKNINIIRSGNVLGAWDRGQDRILTDYFESFKNKKELILRNSNSVRPWIHVFDSLNGYLLSSEYCFENKVSEIFNLSSDKKQTTVSELLSKFDDELCKKTKTATSKESELTETDILKIDSTKAKKVLNWNAEININNLAKLVSEIEKNDSSNVFDIAKRQIENYFNL